VTIGEQFDDAMRCETKAQASLWIERELERYWTQYEVPAPKALEIIKSNLGYMAGYYDEAAAKKISHLFGALHPIFGTDSYFTDVTPEQAFEAGKAFMTELEKK
jgi:hypothetical protein